MNLSKRDELVITAYDLFCNKGFNASGIDTIIAEAKVSKMTMYKYFPTKDDLIVAALEYGHNLFEKEVLEKIAESQMQPAEKIIHLFEVITEIVKNEKMVRCPFINASAEFPDLNHPVHQVAIAHKSSMESFISKNLKAAKKKDISNLSKIISVLFEGALSLTQITGEKVYYPASKTLLINLLKND